MITVILFNTIAVIFAWLESSGIYKHGLKVSVFTIFTFLSLRFDYGNDYSGYLSFFLEINSYKNIDVSDLNIKGIEYGWLFLNLLFGKLFGKIGFFVLTVALAAFTSITLYKFIKKYVPSQYFWFAVFYYVFNYETMLILCSAMRQAIAITFFILAFDFLYRKKLVQYIFLILIASMFHSSAIFLLLIYVVNTLNIRVSKVQIILLLVIFASAMTYQQLVKIQLFEFTSVVLNFYSIYEKGEFGDVSLGLGFAINLIILLTTLYILSTIKSNHSNLYSIIIITSILIIPLSIINPMATRLNYYLLPIMMIIYPNTILTINNKIIKLIFIWIIVLFTIYSFVNFHNSSVHGPHYKVYKTWFVSSLLN